VEKLLLHLKQKKISFLANRKKIYLKEDTLATIGKGKLKEKSSR
jgi:hypothetical protein